jgi:hypothetical protein
MLACFNQKVTQPMAEFQADKDFDECWAPSRGKRYDLAFRYWLASFFYIARALKRREFQRPVLNAAVTRSFSSDKWFDMHH